mmetsp:Transcript_3962/g.10967  ORF Transcript_3962/g.10967 Transcript_3962/m.10967 type:complete len:82 (+) Transcript_3962:926-1171(+)
MSSGHREILAHELLETRSPHQTAFDKRRGCRKQWIPRHRHPYMGMGGTPEHPMEWRAAEGTRKQEAQEAQQVLGEKWGTAS